MSLWHCAEHGLYGPNPWCPRCGKTGHYATFVRPAQVDTHPEGGDANAAPFMSGAVGEADAPETPDHQS